MDSLPPDITNPNILKKTLISHGLEAKKKLGQNFLCSSSIVHQIVDQIPSNVHVLEIGPGPGALTSKLSLKVISTTAVELDPVAVSVLKETAPMATVIHDDVLNIHLIELIHSLSKPIWVVSNMPYNLSGVLLERIGSLFMHIDGTVLMMQKEVGIRIKNLPGVANRGWLSVFLQVNWDISKVCSVPPSSFYPPPKIDSIVLKFIPKKDRRIACENSKNFSTFLKKAFAQPRKKLLNNLINSGYLNKSLWMDIYTSLSFNESVRAHEISNDEWILLFEYLREMMNR